MKTIQRERQGEKRVSILREETIEQEGAECFGEREAQEGEMEKD